MRALVTGGAGFIGSNFLYYLHNRRPEWQLVVVDLLTYAGNLENIKPLIEKKALSFVRADIADAKAVEGIFADSKFDYVFNFAAESHVDRSIASAGEFARTNVLGTTILLNAARQHGVKRYVQISTDEVYGSLGPTGSFVETTPLDPTSPYAASKAAADLIVHSFFKTHQFDTVITRCTNNYGPYQFPEKLIPLFITNALQDKHLPLYGEGLNVRSWIHVDDHSEAVLRVAEKGRSGEVYNIGGAAESELPNVAVTKLILEYLKKDESLIRKVTDRPGHDLRYSVDYSKLKKELAWEPRIRFVDGLKSTIDWYVTNRPWWEKIKSGEYMEFYERLYGARLAQS